jgi:type I site-specific restriction endonuclease
MALKVSREQIEELVLELQDKSASIETAEDLQVVLDLIDQLKSLVDVLVAELHKTFESDEWKARIPKKLTSSAKTKSYSEGVFAAAESVIARLENAFKSAKHLSVELNELSTALKYLLPVYRLGMEFFDNLQDIDQAIKAACEGLGHVFEGSFEESY